MSSLGRFFKAAWRDPVGSNVIATTVVAVAGAIIASVSLIHWWSAIGDFALSIFVFLRARSEVQNWLIGIGGVAACLVLAVLVFACWAALTEQNKSFGPQWRSYVSDQFVGILWRWRYSSEGQVENLCSFCVRCDYQTHARLVSRSFGIEPEFVFRCDSCGDSVGNFDGQPLELESKITRFIQQRLRTNTWPRSSPVDV